MLNSKLTSRINSLAIFCKNLVHTFFRTMPHHWPRAILCLGLTAYSIYLLNCFMTIPVKDYYFDISAMSPDSVVPDIHILVGDENVMNTYSGDYHAHGDSICVVYNFYQTKYHVMSRDFSTGKLYEPAKARLLPIIDTTYHRTKTNTNYSNLFSNAYKNNGKNIFFDPAFSCIYALYYANVASSVPVGYKPPKQVYPLDGHDRLLTKGNEIEGWSNIIYGIYQDTTLAEKLSREHSYFRSNHVIIRPKCEMNTVLDIPICPDRAGNRQGLYRLNPRLMLLFSKENIAMQQYHFYVNTAGVYAYKISLHTRGGAVIQNNPSDVLQVLSLHDTQITKKKPLRNNGVYHDDELERLDTDFKETDVYVQIPENDALQYIRLFFLTLFIGWLMVSFCRNIADGVYKKTGIKLSENWR